MKRDPSVRDFHLLPIIFKYWKWTGRKEQKGTDAYPAANYFSSLFLAVELDPSFVWYIQLEPVVRRAAEN